jgi:hypothetical protein
VVRGQIFCLASSSNAAHAISKLRIQFDPSRNSEQAHRDSL